MNRTRLVGVVALPRWRAGLEHVRTGDRLALQEPMAGGVVLQVDQAAFAEQAVFGQQRERRQDAGVVRHRHLRADCHCQKRASPEILALHLSTDFVGVGF